MIALYVFEFWVSMFIVNADFNTPCLNYFIVFTLTPNMDSVSYFNSSFKLELWVLSGMPFLYTISNTLLFISNLTCTIV